MVAWEAVLGLVLVGGMLVCMAREVAPPDMVMLTTIIIMSLTTLIEMEGKLRY